MGSWHQDMQDVLKESATEDSTEEIQLEVINHLADINQHFRENLELPMFILRLQDRIEYQKKIYKEIVQDLIHDEQHYIRDLHMIIKVFREEIMKVVQDKNELETLFSNIIDIYKTTVILLDSLKDNCELMEIAEEGQMPRIGSCFEALAKTAEFDIYIKYARDINSSANRELLINLLSRLEANAVLQTGYSIRKAVKCYLPDLLLQPIWHCFMYFNYIKDLYMFTPNMEEREILRQIQDLLKPLQMKLTKSVTSLPKKDTRLLIQSRVRRQMALITISKIQVIVDGWDQKDIGQCCDGEFIREDTLKKVANNGQGLTDRKVFLFDELLILCKPNTKDNVATDIVALDKHPTHQREFRLEEKLFIRKVDVIDKKDTEELKNAFEIASREHPNVILIAQSVEDKNNWMADLMMLKSRSMLERTLDSILLEEKKKYPLRLPPAHLYKFVEQDNEENIILENRENGVPLIKGATLIKLVERLTHYTYADPTSVKIFLLTYRSFCSPQELLTLLRERFDVPDPSLFYDKSFMKSFMKKETSACETTEREDWKRYKKEFYYAVQFRVLNVLRHWMDYHFYDFERDGKLLETLLSFLETINDTSVKKWVNLLLKIVGRKRKSSKPITLHFKNRPPPIESHLKIPENNEEYGILTIHPIEFARQLTLLEFELYSSVKSSELVGCACTKDDKNERSANLLKMIRHTTNLTRWLEKIIVEAQNLKERVAIVSRAIEIMIVLQDLNNFNGVLAIVGAMNSASVSRLKFTFQKLSVELQEALTKARQLNNNYVRKYKEVLQLIDPPYVPFLNVYLTNIRHIEEGNPDYLSENPNLINFNKWRKVAEIIGEIQLYQNKPYCLSVESKIRKYIENMCPFKPSVSEANIDNYLYSKSLEIEPKCKASAQFPRKWPEIKLKSPGIKTSRSSSGKSPTPLQTLASSVKFHDPLTETPPPLELPETPPHAPQVTVPHKGDHNIFLPVILEPSGTGSPGSPSSPNMSELLIASSSSSPQLKSPGHLSFTEQITHFEFIDDNIDTVSAVSSKRSPSKTPPSPGNISPSKLRPPPPPKSSRSRKSSFSESSQQVGQASNAPVLPPRDDISPPPIPPRKDILPSQPNGSVTEVIGVTDPSQPSLQERPFIMFNFNIPPGPKPSGTGSSGSPSPPSMSEFSIASSSSSSQPESPEYFPATQQITHFDFSIDTVSAVSSKRSPSRTPPSPGNISPSQLRPPPPPRSNRSRKSSFSESSQKVGKASNAPVLPPRDAISPPPIPPRKDILSSQPNEPSGNGSSGSPSPPSMSELSIASSSSSPQPESPGYFPATQQITHFDFNIDTVSAVSSKRSPSRTPPSPGNISPSQLRPPPPPKSSRSRKSSFSESSQKVGQAPKAPDLPPRDAISPPPLPPRRDIPLQPNGSVTPSLSSQPSLPERPPSIMSNFNTPPGPSCD